MNVSRAILENMPKDQQALEGEIKATTEKLAALIRQRSENEALMALAKQFGLSATVAQGGA